MVEREPLGSTWLPTEPFPPGLQRPLCGSIQALGFAPAAVEKAGKVRFTQGLGNFQRGRSVGGGPQIILFCPSHPLLHLEFFKSFWIKWKNLVMRENEKMKLDPKQRLFFFLTDFIKTGEGKNAKT